jgi:hypothetical protein
MSYPQAYLPKKAPETFEELTQLYLPRKLQDRLGYERALAVIDWLILQAHAKDQLMFLKILRELAADYELELGEQEHLAGRVFFGEA